jgi:hypothetical protein
MRGRYAPHASFYLNSDDFDNPNIDPRVRFRHSGSLLLGYHFSDNIGVGTELTLAGEGIRYQPQKPVAGVESYTHVNLTYFKLPILIRFNTDPTKRAAFQGFVGPQFSFLTGANFYSHINTNNSVFKQTYKSFNYESIPNPVAVPTYESSQTTPDYYTRSTATVDIKEGTTGKTALKELYKGMTVGAVLGLGFKTKVVKSLYIDWVARLDFHFTDIEAKNKYILADYGDMSDGQFVKKGEFDYWDYSRSLLKSRRDARAPSLMLSAGFQLGVTYILDFSK